MEIFWAFGGFIFGVIICLLIGDKKIKVNKNLVTDNINQDRKIRKKQVILKHEKLFNVCVLELETNYKGIIYGSGFISTPIAKQVVQIWRGEVGYSSKTPAYDILYNAIKVYKENYYDR